MDRHSFCITLTTFGGLWLLLLTLTVVTPSTHAVRPYYKHFDEYLTSLSRKMPGPLADEVETDRGSRKHKNLILRKLTENGKGGHRHNTSCCMLGELAGDKGFHCYVEYYVARITMRNRNRAHNRKTGFYGRYRVPRYGQRLMKTFEKCVAGHGSVFHKCCHLATLERRDRDQYYLARLQSNQSKPSGRRHRNVTADDHNATATDVATALAADVSTANETHQTTKTPETSTTTTATSVRTPDHQAATTHGHNANATTELPTTYNANPTMHNVNPTMHNAKPTVHNVTADEIESDDEEISRTLL